MSERGHSWEVLDVTVDTRRYSVCEKSSNGTSMTCVLFSMFIMLKYNAFKSPHKEYSADSFAV